MRVFLTGATGFIGSAISQELKRAGHQVIGLARSDAAVAKLEAAGVEPHLGDLENHEALAAGACHADGVIHTAYVHNFADIGAASEIDEFATAALVRALEGSGKPLVITSGVTVLSQGRLGTEKDAVDPQSAGLHRLASEDICLDAASRGIRAMIMRPAPSVHGLGDHGFIPYLYGLAAEHGYAAQVGEGENRWPAIHVLDAAELYRLALEHGTSGSVYHAVAEQAIPFRQIADVISRHLGVELKSLRPEDAPAYFGRFERFARLDLPISSQFTQTSLNWTARQISLITDISNAAYFR